LPEVAVTVGVGVAAAVDVVAFVDRLDVEAEPAALETTAASAPDTIAPLSVAADTTPNEAVAATPSTVVPMVNLRRRRLARDRASVRPLLLLFMPRSCPDHPFGIVTVRRLTPSTGGARVVAIVHPGPR
jgi:hypothetical protein